MGRVISTRGDRIVDLSGRSDRVHGGITYKTTAYVGRPPDNRRRNLRAVIVFGLSEGLRDISTSYVPFRNANLLSMETSYAEATDSEALFIGAHSEDFSGCPDCRPAFFDAFQNVIDVGTKPETEIELKTPFVEWSKTEIAERGLEPDVPYEMTWSCYRDEEPACGTCDACAFRLEVFRNAGSSDPIA